MSAYTRLYRMTARDGQGAALRAALEDLAGKVCPIDGCQGIELLEDADKTGTFVLIERWASAEVHRTGSAALGKDAFAPVIAVLAEPPEASGLSPLN